MRPVEYPHAQIIAAGQALEAAGKSVTSFALRQSLGGGNPKRLKSVWEEHVANRAAAPAQMPDLPAEVAAQVVTINASLSDQITGLAKSISATALALAERRAAESTHQAQQAREQMSIEIDDAARTVDEMESALNDARAQSETQQAEIEALRKTAHEQELGLAKLTGELEAVRAEHAQLLASLGAHLAATEGKSSRQRTRKPTQEAARPS